MTPSRILAVTVILIAATACGAESESSGPPADIPGTTVAIAETMSSAEVTASGGEGTRWDTDVTAEELCTYAEPTDVEAIVGRPLAGEPTGTFSVNVATCFYNFDADSAISSDSLTVRVWPAAEWGDRTPQEAYQYRYEINVQPGEVEVTVLEDIGVEAHLMEIDDQSWVMVLTDGRLFEVQSSTVTPEQLVEVARQFADDL